MASIVALASDATALNLALSGVRVEEFSEILEAEKRCGKLLDDRLDVLIIEERFRDGFSERMQERLRRHTGAPIIVQCPEFEREDSEVDAYLASIIRPAVGFEIRLD